MIHLVEGKADCHKKWQKHCFGAVAFPFFKSLLHCFPILIRMTTAWMFDWPFLFKLRSC